MDTGRYVAVCVDAGNNDYAEVEVTAKGFSHALQKIAAQLPDEEPDTLYISWHRIPPGKGPA